MAIPPLASSIFAPRAKTSKTWQGNNLQLINNRKIPHKGTAGLIGRLIWSCFDCQRLINRYTVKFHTTKRQENMLESHNTTAYLTQTLNVGVAFFCFFYFSYSFSQRSWVCMRKCN